MKVAREALFVDKVPLFEDETAHVRANRWMELELERQETKPKAREQDEKGCMFAALPRKEILDGGFVKRRAANDGEPFRDVNVVPGEDVDVRDGDDGEKGGRLGYDEQDARGVDCVVAREDGDHDGDEREGHDVIEHSGRHNPHRSLARAEPLRFERYHGERDCGRRHSEPDQKSHSHPFFREEGEREAKPDAEGHNRANERDPPRLADPVHEVSNLLLQPQAEHHERDPELRKDVDEVGWLLGQEPRVHQHKPAHDEPQQRRHVRPVRTVARHPHPGPHQSEVLEVHHYHVVRVVAVMRRCGLRRVASHLDRCRR
mmetsp:Transcript_27721/g.90687  ORF Transcript_27721/g.90687 Transcript_27721/m.90687 type:complete len:316 (-) Transcript_27721:49-996(-)